jgi:hypothetical protein
VNRAPDPASSFYSRYGTNALTNVLIDLFLAGIETTSSTLLWTFLYMLHHPETQKKMHDEIDYVSYLNTSFLTSTFSNPILTIFFSFAQCFYLLTKIFSYSYYFFLILTFLFLFSYYFSCAKNVRFIIGRPFYYSKIIVA